MAREEHHARRCVALVELEVEVQPEPDDGDELEEVHGQEVRLGAVGLPEGLRGGGQEGGDPAAGFVRRDGPGGKGRDFAVEGGGGRGGESWFVLVSEGTEKGRGEGCVRAFSRLASGSTSGSASGSDWVASSELWAVAEGSRRVSSWGGREVVAEAEERLDREGGLARRWWGGRGSAI